MSRSEIYPWSLLTEVGDYFVVPKEYKPHDYVHRLIAQTNYKRTNKRYVCTRTTFGSIVLLAEVDGEVPPHEFVTQEGILASTSRSHLISTQAPETLLGNRPTRAKLTRRQIIEQMSTEVKKANLPWWHDPRTRALVWNTRVATKEDTDRWYMKQFAPGPDVDYPDYYNLDENLLTRVAPPDEEVDDFEEAVPMINDGESDVSTDDE